MVAKGAANTLAKAALQDAPVHVNDAPLSLSLFAITLVCLFNEPD